MIFASHSAEARVVDRVVAIAGPHVVMMSEVRREAAPYLAQVHEKDPLARAQGETVVLRDACERLIDAALEEDEAGRLHLEATPDEVEAGIDAVAKNNGTTRDGVLALAAEHGMDAARYRDEIRRQILEGKLLQLRHPDPNKLDAARAALVAELRANVYVEDRLAP
ncbi:MAG TPA: SurA N-terminal domain-containing protein [Polyangiaceae bacterium]|jgi:peptidyl-prolyl cis-trans isomerase SurA